MRLATTLLLVAVLALMAGCGDSAEEAPAPGPTERGAASKREVRSAWERTPSCRRPGRASRWGCSVGSYRCQGVVTGRGWSVSCAKPGRSVSFTVPRD